MGTAMTLAAGLLIVFSKGGAGITIKGGIAGLVLTYTQQVNTFFLLEVYIYVRVVSVPGPPLRGDVEACRHTSSSPQP